MIPLVGRADGTVEARPLHEVGLHADDRLDPVLVRRLDEFDDAVEVSVIGDRYRRLPVIRRRGDNVGDARRSVEEGVLGVKM